jgi:NaMN:DMB phosphoribosyltransferase
MALFYGRIRRWREDKPGGLAVIDIPLELVAELGGRRQMRVVGSLNGAPFAGSTMLVAGGGFCVGVSRAALKAVKVSVGEEVEVELKRVTGERVSSATSRSSARSGRRQKVASCA